MFKDNWLAFAALLVLLGLLLDQQALLVMAVLLATAMSVARLWERVALHRVRYRRTLSEVRAFAGETVVMTLELANHKPLPLSWIRVEDRFPETMAPEGRDLLPSGMPGLGLLVNVAALSWHEQVRWRYRIPCHTRGFYFFGPVSLFSGDIFGIFERERVLPERTRLIVYPQVQPLAKLGLPAKNPFGGQRAALPVFEDPVRVVGVRDYHPDDPMRRVHWKASARAQQLQVRVWEPTRERQLVVLLNVATYERYWQGINRELLEWLISVAASICLHAFEEKSAVGLLANASVPGSDQPVKVAPGRSPHQMRFILEALAAITPFATGSLDKLLRAESPKLGWGATLVVVSAVVTEALLAQMLRLHRAGRQLALVSLDNDFAEAEADRLRAQGIVVHRLPHRFTLREARRALADGDGHSPDESWMRPAAEDPHAAFKPKGEG